MCHVDFAKFIYFFWAQHFMIYVSIFFFAHSFSCFGNELKIWARLRQELAKIIAIKSTLIYWWVQKKAFKYRNKKTRRRLILKREINFIYSECARNTVVVHIARVIIRWTFSSGHKAFSMVSSSSPRGQNDSYVEYIQSKMLFRRRFCLC